MTRMIVAAAVLAGAGALAASWHLGLITWLWFEVMTHMAP